MKLTLIELIENATAVLAFLNGAICLLNPGLAIRIQQKFYEKINWKIEPINLIKELRNTRIMGLISLILSIILIIHSLR
ncbi:MAG: hypothetical protein PHS93_03800 [Candidatus Omnitrophica bacterium]|nr:hypothetical protein [Candidatus Omnitrophota bacterium]MDD5352276.1 hypothetical protein [Candidatus Omnitrophota bacterium]MDD5549875.1 hypothetical protein [Candidatus Omnitrophota bacterium]